MSVLVEQRASERLVKEHGRHGVDLGVLLRWRHQHGERFRAPGNLLDQEDQTSPTYLAREIVVLM